MHLQFLSKAFKTGSIAPMWPWGSLGAMGLVGRLASNVAAATVLSAVSGTPAASGSVSSLTASYSILAPNNPASLLFTSKLRQVPTKLAILPYDSGSGIIRWYTTT